MGDKVRVPQLAAELGGSGPLPHLGARSLLIKTVTMFELNY